MSKMGMGGGGGGGSLMQPPRPMPQPGLGVSRGPQIRYGGMAPTAALPPQAGQHPVNGMAKMYDTRPAPTQHDVRGRGLAQLMQAMLGRAR
jgi:hypothetical protein